MWCLNSKNIILIPALAVLSLAQPSMAQYPGLSDPGSSSSSGGGFAPVEAEVDGGPIPLGATAQVVVRFKNEDSQPVRSGFIRLYPSSTVSANVSMNQCEDEPLPSGAECAIALSVKSLQSGPWRVEMLMSHSGKTRLVAAIVSGQVEVSSDGADSLSTDIEAVPSKLEFGTLGESQSLVESVILRNITSTKLDIEDIYIDASDQSGFGLKTECTSLEAGEACLAIVNWAPRQEGRASGVLVVEHSGPAGLSSVSLSGEYNPDEVEEAEIYPRAVPGKGLLVSSQRELNFGQDVATASTITVSLVNAGDTPLTIGDVEIAGADNGLSFKEGGCKGGTILDPIEACPLTLAWSPTRVGDVYDDIKVRHNGARGILILPVRGEAISTVSQDQKAIVISGNAGQTSIVSSAPQASSNGGSNSKKAAPPPRPFSGPTLANPAAALDGYKITSFSPKRAIINGPGGSRLVFTGEEAVIGGIAWAINIQPNGIEFNHNQQRVLMLFDRSLSSISRVTASESSDAGSSSSSDDGS